MPALYALATLFCLLGGRNDGSPLVALDMRNRRRASVAPFLLMLASVALIPMVSHGVGDSVVALMTTETVPQGSFAAVVLISCAATLTLLNLAGVPTSITLALVGASSAVGYSTGDADWAHVARILAMAFVAPFLAFAVSRALRAVTVHIPSPSGVQGLTLLGYILVCIAYGANDGQKMIAILSTTHNTSLSDATVDPALILTVVAAFALGTAMGMSKGARSLQRGTIAPNPAQAGTTMLAAAATVLISSLAGAPVSMTQSISGALVGTCPANDWKRVRWNEVRRIAIAWAATLPCSWLLGYAIASILPYIEPMLP